MVITDQGVICLLLFVYMLKKNRDERIREKREGDIWNENWEYGEETNSWSIFVMSHRFGVFFFEDNEGFYGIIREKKGNYQATYRDER